MGPLAVDSGGDVFGVYVVLAMFGLLAVGLVVWVVAGEVSERRKAKAAVRVTTSSRGTGRRRARHRP